MQGVILIGVVMIGSFVALRRDRALAEPQASGARRQ
jgi:hypothetical protein